MSQPPSGGGPPDRFSRMFPFPGMIPIHALSPLEVERLLSTILPRSLRDVEGFAVAHAAPPGPSHLPCSRSQIDALLDAHAYSETTAPEAPGDEPKTRSRAAASKKRQLEAEDCADKAACPVCLDAREEGCRAVRMPCCGQRFHRGCLLTWLSAESDKCPTCRGELPSPAKKARCAYEALGVAELKRRCDERHVDASACVEKAELVKLLARDRDEDDAKRAARRAAGHPIPVPIFAAAHAAAASMAARRRAVRVGRRRRRRRAAAGGGPPPGARGSRRRARAPRRRARARAAPRRPAAARRASRRGPAPRRRARSPFARVRERARAPPRVPRTARRAARRAAARPRRQRPVARARGGDGPPRVAGRAAPAFIRALFESARARRLRGLVGEPSPRVIRVNRDDLEQGGMPFPSPSR
ncbi:hypothetical protein SO694_000372119 [Aureococcus anophagefferens]|uniref:RING-type domain-containing protein n=1 Tax=Aureococcus anophagefferens TaxID=44056 RepID=A0ABR1FL21_AURAN